MKKQEILNANSNSDAENIISTPQEYINNRVEDQIRWLFGKSGQNRKRYFQIRVLQIGMSISLPALIGLREIFQNATTYTYFSTLSLIISVGVLLLEVISSNFRFYELWLEYREMGGSLERELQFFRTRSGPYQIESPTLFNDFVLTVERIIWNSSQNKK